MNSMNQMNRSMDSCAEELLNNGYHLCRLVGRGANAAVYEVFKENARYACKVSTETEALKRESFFLEQIENSLFPKEYAFWEGRGMAYLVTEYAEGIELDQYIGGKGFPTQEEALCAAAQIAEGIRYLEDMDRPMLYRDLKAENIMYDAGRVKIIDMGCACFLDSVGRERVGTQGYAPPEQIMAQPEHRTVGQGMYSDVYAFGRLLHYMLTGDSPYLPPFEKPDIRAYDRSFDRELETLVTLCTRKNPPERPPDMRYVCRELEKISQKRKKTGGKSFFRLFDRRREKKGGCTYQYEKNIFLGFAAHNEVIGKML